MYVGFSLFTSLLNLFRVFFSRKRLIITLLVVVCYSFKTYFDYLLPVVVCTLAAWGQFVVCAAEELHTDEDVAFAFRRHFQPPHCVDYL